MSYPAVSDRSSLIQTPDKPIFLPQLKVPLATSPGTSPTSSPSPFLTPQDLFLPGTAQTTAQKASAPPLQAFVDDAVESPSLAAIRQGKIMDLGQSGASVKEIQKMLSKAGFGVSQSGSFGPTTQGQVKAFQKCWKLSETGQIGPTTLKMLEQAQDGSSPLAKAMAQSARAIANARGTTGQCYNAVAEAIENNLPNFLWGMHAYMAADQLADHPRFREIPAPADMNKLPVGAVVVWGQGRSESGHISVHLGQGLEASDHIEAQMQSHYGGGSARVFVAR
ncbi:MAG: peptidoglycan-binding protein [Candidatus Sericytochromatia bacterium]